MRLSTGFSIIWQSPLGPLRADIAQALLKADFDKTELFRFVDTFPAMGDDGPLAVLSFYGLDRRRPNERLMRTPFSGANVPSTFHS